MNIVQINQTSEIGSTGKIMSELNSVINQNGYSGYMVCAYALNEYSNQFCTNRIKNNWISIRMDLLISRITGYTGYRNKKTTKRIIKWIDSVKPDIIHIHNIHGDWINLNLLFKYISNNNIPVVWTLHDAWAFTGRCSHFEDVGCDKWKNGCENCNNKKIYPITYFFDHSNKMWNDKKKWYKNLNINIVTPSNWLSNYVKESIMNNFPVYVINNGINLEVYNTTNKKSKYLNSVNNKKIILGVASSWSKQKGLEDFIKLDGIINHNKYQIVLVGLNSKQKHMLPKTILAIERTNNQKELVSLYSAADVFLNLTYLDTFPTTNIEAIACGTVAISYRTGGSPESIVDKKYILEKGDVEGVYKVIRQICDIPSYSSDELRKIAEERYDKYRCYSKYIDLYKSLKDKKNQENSIGE